MILATTASSIEGYQIVAYKGTAVMTMPDAAKFLGISNPTLDRYVREAAIPYTPLPKRGTRVQVRFLRSQLITWLRQRTVKPDRWTSRTGRL